VSGPKQAAGSAAAAASTTGVAQEAGAATAPSALVVVDAGVCGHGATVRAAKTGGYNVRVELESDCPHVQKIAPEPIEVDALRQIGLRGGLPPLLESAYACCAHAACPAPSAVIKAVEVAAGLALPDDVTMTITKEG
jgi:Family of unknown function (DUF6951)